MKSLWLYHVWYLRLGESKSAIEIVEVDSLCTGKACPIRKGCLRYKVVSEGISQSWIDGEYRDSKCPNYIAKLKLKPKGIK